MSNISGSKSENQSEPPFVSEVKLDQFFVARFTPDQDLFGSLKGLMREKGLERLLVMSGIGSFKNITMRDLKLGIEKPVNLDKTNEIIKDGPFELLSLEGSVVPMDDDLVVHLHGLLGLPDGGVIGGHLFEAQIFTTLELFVAGITDIDLNKRRSPITGLTEYYI